MKYFENSRKVHLRLKCLLNLWNPLLKTDVVYGLDCDIFETLSHYTEKASILNESLIFKRKVVFWETQEFGSTLERFLEMLVVLIV